MKKTIYKIFFIFKNRILSSYIFIKSIKIYRRQYEYYLNKRFPLYIRNLYPQISDRTRVTGYDRHYVMHTAWAARILSKIKPTVHTDISSSIYFNAIVSAFIPVNFYDFRPANLRLSGLQCLQGNLLNLPFKDNELKTISCMHVIEHIGLGRYGDEMDINGDIKAIKELVRVTDIKGNILIAVPIGIERLEFNAHRVYSYEHIISLFNDCKLVEFSLIDDDLSNYPILNPELNYINKQTYGCGLFWFEKL